MSDGIHSPANQHLAQIASLMEENAALKAENAFLTKQRTEQGFHVNNLDRQLSDAEATIAKLRRQLPRPTGKRGYTNKLGAS